MNEKYLRKLQARFRNLNFNDELINNCLNNAIYKVQNNNVNASTMYIDIENEFINNIISLIKDNHNDYINDIISGFNNVHQHFINNHYELINNISDVELNECFLTAFKLAIQEFNGSKFSNILIQKLNFVYKNHKDNKNNINNPKNKSLFEYFSNYDRNFVLFAVKTLGSNYYKFLISIYGIDLYNRNLGLSYKDNEKLNSILRILNDRLKVMQLLKANNFSDEEIGKLFNHKEDELIIRIVKVINNLYEFYGYIEKQDLKRYMSNHSLSIKRPDYFIDYILMDEDMKLYEDQIREVWPEMVKILKEKYPAMYPVITDVYGEDLTSINNGKPYNFIPNTEKLPILYTENRDEFKTVKGIISRVKFILKDILNIEENIKKIEKDDKPQYFIDYFINDAKFDMSYEDIKRLLPREVIKIKSTNTFIYELISKLYGQKFESKYTGVILSKENYKTIDKAIENIKKDLLRLKENEKISEEFKQKNTTRYSDGLINFFSHNPNMIFTIDEIELYYDEIVETIKLNYPILYESAQQIYGISLNEYTNKQLSPTDKEKFKRFISKFYEYLQILVDGKKLEIRAVNRIDKYPNGLIDYLSHNPYANFSHEDIINNFNNIINILKVNYPEEYELLSRIYGINLKEKYTNFEMNEVERELFHMFLNHFYEELNIILNNNEIVENNNLTIEKDLSYNTNDNDLPYMDALILKTYSLYQDSDKVKTLLNIKEDELIDSYINNLEYYSNKIEIINYILTNHPEKLNNILESSYMKNNNIYLTNLEKQYIYLKLLSRLNNSLTDDVISNILNIDNNELNDYEIMTPEDSINSLNRYLK